MRYTTTIKVTRSGTASLAHEDGKADEKCISRYMGS